MEAIMDNMQINIFSADDKDTILSNIHIPVRMSGSYSYDAISSSEFYDAVSQKYDIRTDNIVLYYRNKCLRYNERPSGVYPASIDVQLAVCLPQVKDLKYQDYYDTAKRCNIPVFESVEVMDQEFRKICKIIWITHNTTVAHIKNEVEYLIKTQAFYLYYNNKKWLFSSQLIADVCFESGAFKPTIKLFVESYSSIEKEKDLRVVNLEFISKRITLDFIENDIYNMETLKIFIYHKYKIPIRQQKLIHNGRVITDEHQLLNSLYIEDDSNYTGSISISVMIEPFYIDVKFESNCIEFPGNGRMRLSGMATEKEIKERLGEILCVSPETLVLDGIRQIPSIDRKNDTYLHEVPFRKMTHLHEGRKHMIQLVREITVYRSILVQIHGKKAFSHRISHKRETIKEIKRQLEIYNDCGTLVFVSKMNGKNLRTNTRLLDLVDKGITLTFERQEAKRCVLL